MNKMNEKRFPNSGEKEHLRYSIEMRNHDFEKLKNQCEIFIREILKKKYSKRNEEHHKCTV